MEGLDAFDSVRDNTSEQYYYQNSENIYNRSDNIAANLMHDLFSEDVTLKITNTLPFGLSIAEPSCFNFNMDRRQVQGQSNIPV